MKENKWEQVKNIFQAVLERPSPEREQFLGKICRYDRDLHDEVCELLALFREDDSFLDKAAIGEVAEFFAGNHKKLKIGENLGRYRIKSALGAGGMGEVFLAEDTELERLVALKVLSDVFSRDHERVQRFILEAKSASTLNHPNILTIHEISRINDVRFIATEYVKGETLRQRQRRKTLRLPEILDISVQVASALTVLHEAKIIHCDIKPENIMLREDGLVKVLDFGLAKLIGKKEKTAFIMGTISYMSPEQARGKPTDARTDIWSLGICLYEMLAGVQPFAGQTASDTIAAILKSRPAPLSVGTPAELRRIVRKTLQKNRKERYQTVKDLLIDLKKLRRKLDLESEITKQYSRDR